MLKFIKSNIREIILFFIVFVAMLFGVGLLGDPSIAENPAMSALVTLSMSLMGGFLKFSICLLLIWFGLSITLPEAGRFMFGQTFDSFWEKSPGHYKGYICLAAAGVLGIMAALCMAS